MTNLGLIGGLRMALATPVREGARKVRRQLLADAAHCEQIQAETLARVLGLASGSRWHKHRGLSPSVSPRQLAKTLPITGYDDYAKAMENVLAGDVQALLGDRQKAVMFALSSGTTGRTKYIPVTKSFLADYRRGWQAWGIGTFDAHRRLHSHNIFQIASGHDRMRSPSGVPCGNISGLVQTMQSPIVRTMYSVPCSVLQVRDPQVKAYAALKAGLCDRRVAMAMAANPSTLVQLAEIARTRTEDLIRDLFDGTLTIAHEPADEQAVPMALRRKLSVRRRSRARELEAIASRDGALTPRGYWPQLTVLACWTGGSCAAYLPRLRDLYLTADGCPVPIRDHGLSASEGRMTIPLEDETASGLLDIRSHFFEFVPEDRIDDGGPTLLAHELEVGATYYILLTTTSGLVRYDIHDVVRCTGYYGTTPLLEFLHKGAHIASLTGEKITESQVVTAVRSGCSASPFSVAPEWGETKRPFENERPEPSSPPGYVLLVEPDASGEVPEADVVGIDRTLRSLNEEYDEKRASERLRPLRLQQIPAGTFARFATHRQAHVGGSAEQYKHPFLLPQLGMLDDLMLHADSPAAVAAKLPSTGDHSDHSLPTGNVVV